jgi:hypothetical protein
MRLRHAVTGLAAISTHAVIGFTHDALYAATGELVVAPKLAHWLAQYGWLCASGILLAMLGLQLYIDYPIIRANADRQIEQAEQEARN